MILNDLDTLEDTYDQTQALIQLACDQRDGVENLSDRDLEKIIKTLNVYYNSLESAFCRLDEALGATEIWKRRAIKSGWEPFTEHINFES